MADPRHRQAIAADYRDARDPADAAAMRRNHTCKRRRARVGGLWSGVGIPRALATPFPIIPTPPGDGKRDGIMML